MHLGMFSCYVSLLVDGRRTPRLFPRAAVLLVFLLPLGVDGLANFFLLWSSPGWFRAATGLGAGLALPLLLLMLVEVSDEMGLDSRSVANFQSTFVFLILRAAVIGAVGIWLLAHPSSVIMFRCLELAAGTGTLLFFAQFSRAWFRCFRPRGHVESTRRIAV